MNADPRLAAKVMMLQLVRTDLPITAAEKTTIMELMESPLGIADIETSSCAPGATRTAAALFRRSPTT